MMTMEKSSSSSFPVFIDTNLDTHVSLLINRDDTVAQLKGRMMSEHPLCFPQIGEISVRTVKVKLGEMYYHLPDSMIVRVALEHIMGVKLLNIDLLPALCPINNQTQTKLTDNSGVQPQKYNSLSINHNASFLPTRSEVYHHESIPGDHKTKKDLIPDLVSREHENTTLPGACEQTPSEHAISDAVQQSFDNDTDINNKEERVVLEHKNAIVETKKDAQLVSDNNEKYREQNSSMHGDEIIPEKDHVEKREQKKDKVVNSDSIQEAAVVYDSLVSSRDEKYQKENSSVNCDENLSEKDHAEKRKRKKDEDVKLDNFQKAAVQLDSPMQEPSDVKLKRKKRKVSSSNDELPKNNPVPEKSVEAIVSSSKDMGKEASSLHSSTPQVQSTGQAVVDTKKKRRRKVLEEPPQNKLINNSLNEGDASNQDKSVKENHVQVTNKNEKNSETVVTHGHDSSGTVNANAKEIQAQESNEQDDNKTAAADSSVGDKKKRRTYKKKEMTEPLVQELHAEKTEQQGKEKSTKEASDNPTKVISEAAASEKKPKRSQKKTEPEHSIMDTTVQPNDVEAHHANIPKNNEPNDILKKPSEVSKKEERVKENKEAAHADTEKINFLQHFERIAKQHETVEEKSSKKTKRKKKLNASPCDSTATVKTSKREQESEKGTPSKRIQNSSVKGKGSSHDVRKAALDTIFDYGDSDSGSSVDDFLISSRHVPGKKATSSETDDGHSDDSGETNISLGTADGKGINSPTKSSIREGSISKILMSTNSYRKAKLTASQSEFDDIDMVPNTQQDSPEI